MTRSEIARTILTMAVLYIVLAFAWADLAVVFPGLPVWSFESSVVVVCTVYFWVVLWRRAR